MLEKVVAVARHLTHVLSAAGWAAAGGRAGGGAPRLHGGAPPHPCPGATGKRSTADGPLWEFPVHITHVTHASIRIHSGAAPVCRLGERPLQESACVGNHCGHPGQSTPAATDDTCSHECTFLPCLVRRTGKRSSTACFTGCTLLRAVAKCSLTTVRDDVPWCASR